MKGLDLGALTKALAKNKYALLVLCVGLGLLLLPRRASDGGAPAETAAAYSATVAKNRILMCSPLSRIRPGAP